MSSITRTKSEIKASAVGLTILMVLAVGTPNAEAQNAREKSGGGEGSSNRVDAIVGQAMTRLEVAVDRHWHKGEYNHIINLARMMLAANPSDLETIANTGWLLWSMNRDSEAIALYEQGLKDNPKSSFMYDEIGQYYYTRKKDYNKAIQYYEQAVKYANVPPFTRHLLAHAYERTGQLVKSAAMWEIAVEDQTDPTLAAAAKRNLERVRQKLKSGPPN